MYAYESLTNSFYPFALQSSYQESASWPEAYIEINDEEYQRLMDGQASGLDIVSGDDGVPFLIERRPSKYHAIKKGEWSITSANQKKLDADLNAAAESAAKSKVLSLRSAADYELQLLQYRVDLDRATPEHLARMVALKGFIVDLDDWRYPEKTPGLL